MIRPNMRALLRRSKEGKGLKHAEVKDLIDYLRFVEVRAVQLGNLAQDGRDPEAPQWKKASEVIGEIMAAMKGNPSPEVAKTLIEILAPPAPEDFAARVEEACDEPS